MNDRYRNRDQRVADDAIERDETQLMCQADGCPHRWSVAEGFGDRIRGLCSAHRWTDPRHWDAVTQRLHWRMADQSRRDMQPQAAPRLSRDEKVALLQRVRAILTSQQDGGSKAWAESLRDREQRGEKLSPAQRYAWRDALRVAQTPEASA